MAKSSKGLQKVFNDHAVTSGEDLLLSDVPGYLSTGWSLLDIQMGGGFPLGRTVELFGLESTGKSTLMLQVAASCQSQGGQVVFLDSENTFSRSFAQRLGVDDTKCHFLPPTLTIDEALQSFNTLATALRDELPEVPMLFVWDTLNSSPTRKETEIADGKGSFAPTIGGQRAQIVRSYFRTLTPTIAKTKVCFVIVNHVYESIGKMFGPKHITPGGSGPKYHASIRLNLMIGGQIKDADEEIVGHTVYAKVEKNKFGPPRRRVTSRFLFNEGFSDEWSIFDYLTGANIIKRSGSWYSMPTPSGTDEKIRKADFVHRVREVEGLWDFLRETAMAHYREAYYVPGVA